MRKHHPDISIVIPNYNGKALLQKNLPAVLAAADGYPGVCQVIVVDDASTEAGFESIINQFKTVLCLRHARNKGFAETIHTGVEVTTAELLVFLNSDVAPDVDFLEPLASAFKSIYASCPQVGLSAGEFQV